MGTREKTLFSPSDAMPEEMVDHISNFEWREICGQIDGINSEGSDCAWYSEFFCCLVCVPLVLLHPCLSRLCIGSFRRNQCRSINARFFGGMDIFFEANNKIYINCEVLKHLSPTNKPKSFMNPLAVLAEF